MITETLFLDYQTKLIKGDRAGCTQIVKKLLASVIPIKQLYVDLFQRSLYEVGALWEANKISVATEHLCTAITENLISLTYPYLFTRIHCGKKAIITCTPGEYHQIGARMVADYFEMNGWDGHFLGANTPEDELIQFIAEQQPDLLAISMSVFFNLSSLEKLINKVHLLFPNLLILLGGQGFLWGVENKLNKLKDKDYIYILHSLDELDEKFFNPLSNFN